MITLTPSQLSSIINDARSELVRMLITEHKNEFDFISPAQAAGLLDVSAPTMLKLKIPRYVFAAKTIVRYKLSEVLAYIAASRE